MMLREGNYDFFSRAANTYYIRKRSVYRRLIQMTTAGAVSLLLERRDKLHGIGSDTAWEVLLTRKPEKYEKWI